MKKINSIIIILAVMAFSSFSFIQTASAESVTMIGALSKIELAADGKSAIAVLKDNKSGEAVTILVTDELTLDKIKDKRIVEGDEIRSKYDKSDKGNKSKIFKKTAGC